MNKKLISAISAVALTLPITVITTEARANTQTATVAVLDTAINSSLPIFKDKIAYEVCILEWASCPNGQKFMEGPGSANLPLSILNNGQGFDHGTQMTSLAVQTNASVNIVFIKVIGTNLNGLRQASGEATVYNALEWVIQNKERFNIQAVSMSQGHHNLAAGKDYCPKTPITESKILTLKSMNVGVFFPTGNTRDYSRIDWPACIPSSIAIGATMPAQTVAIYSNHDPLLTDFFAQGTIQAITAGGKKINVAGTSASTVIAATSWATIKASKPTLTYDQIYDLISKTSTFTYNSKVPSGKLVNLTGALNG